jgi:hypothetical protein
MQGETALPGFRFVLAEQNHRKAGRLITKDLSRPRLALLSLRFDLFFDRFADSIGLGGFVLQNFRFFFFALKARMQWASWRATQSQLSQRQALPMARPPLNSLPIVHGSARTLEAMLRRIRASASINEKGD